MRLGTALPTLAAVEGEIRPPVDQSSEPVPRGRDGKTLGPPMPYDLYRRLADNDVKAMVAYLRTVAPVRNVVPRGQYKIPLPDSYGPPVGTVPDPPRQDPVKYGEYLAGPVAHCMEC